MTLKTIDWEDVPEEELRAEGNIMVSVTVPEKAGRVDQGVYHLPGVRVENHLAYGWLENPQTGSLGLRRRVHIAEVDDVILVEFHTYAKGEWLSVGNTAFVYDPEGMAAMKQEREEQEEAQRQAMAAAHLGVGPQQGGLVRPGAPSNRAQRRRPGQ